MNATIKYEYVIEMEWPNGIIHPNPSGTHWEPIVTSNATEWTTHLQRCKEEYPHDNIRAVARTTTQNILG